MSIRLNMPIPWSVSDVFPNDQAGEAGTGSLIMDLATESGYREFDVCVAAQYRATEWRLRGSVTTNQSAPTIYSATCLYDITFASTLSGVTNTRTDEGTLASRNLNSVAGGSRILLPIHVADFVDVQFGPPGLESFRIVRDSDGNRTKGFHTLKMDAADNAHATSQTQTVSTFGDPAWRVGQVVVSVPGWRGVETHSIAFPLFVDEPVGFTAVTVADFTLTATKSYAYDGIWNPLTAQNIMDPVTSGI